MSLRVWSSGDELTGTIDCNSNILTVQLSKSHADNWYPLNGLKIEFPVVYRSQGFSEFLLEPDSRKFLGNISSLIQSGDYIRICTVTHDRINRHHSSPSKEDYHGSSCRILSHYRRRIILSCRGANSQVDRERDE